MSPWIMIGAGLLLTGICIAAWMEFTAPDDDDEALGRLATIGSTDPRVAASSVSKRHFLSGREDTCGGAVRKTGVPAFSLDDGGTGRLPFRGNGRPSSHRPSGWG
jgi:hypothetical protein